MISYVYIYIYYIIYNVRYIEGKENVDNSTTN